jgi:cellulose biosynthesis protein BcsQ
MIRLNTQIARLAINIAILNFKGGVGKTTSSHMFALLRAGRAYQERVLLLDMDKQMNLTAALQLQFGEYEGNIASALHSFLGGWSPEDLAKNIYHRKIPAIGQKRLFVIPGHPRFSTAMTAMEELRNEGDGTIDMRLATALQQVERHFDWVVMDTAPAIDDMPATLALRAADVLLVPVTDLAAAHGLVDVLRKVIKLHNDRVYAGQPPLQVLMFSPRHMHDGKAEPYGPHDVKNDTWYPVLYETFPDHFVAPVVGHSVGYHRTFKEGKLSFPSTEQRREYLAMHEDLVSKIQNTKLPKLSQTLASGHVDLDKLDARLKACGPSDEGYRLDRVKFK